jgi:hypothetical protein
MVTKQRAAQVAIGDLPIGTKFRLYGKYRDGSPRPRLKFGKKYLAGETLTVLRHEPGCTIVGAGRAEVPLCSDWTVLA